MNIREKLENLRTLILYHTDFNKDYEFNTILEDHPLGNQNIYRLHYINYHRFGENYQEQDKIGLVDWPFEPFVLPENMTREDAFKVLSYLTDFIERDFNLEECSFQSVSLLNNALDLGRLGFKKYTKPINNDNEVVDLFTVSGRVLLFKKSDYYSKYFNWYTEGVTFDEVKDIYEKCHMEFYDLKRVDNPNIKTLEINKK